MELGIDEPAFVEGKFNIKKNRIQVPNKIKS